jgi:hypothetical protein
MSGEEGEVLDIPEGKAREAYEEVEEIADEIPKKELAPLRFPVDESTGRALFVSQHANEDLPQFKAVYKKPPEKEIRLLGKLAYALKGADLQRKAVKIVPVSKEDIRKLRKVRKKALRLVRLVFEGNEKMQKKADEIDKGRGHPDLAGDGIEIHDIIIEDWPLFEKTGLISKEEVEDLEKLSYALLAWSGRHKDQPSLKEREAEQRVWTLLVNAYHPVREYARILYLDNLEEWEYRYPSLFAFELPPRPKKQTSNPDPT